jgi:hypothetical protein
MISCICAITWVQKTHENWTRKKWTQMNIWDNREGNHTYHLPKNLGRHNTRWEESWCLHQIKKKTQNGCHKIWIMPYKLTRCL